MRKLENWFNNNHSKIENALEVAGAAIFILTATTIVVTVIASFIIGAI